MKKKYFRTGYSAYRFSLSVLLVAIVPATLFAAGAGEAAGTITVLGRGEVVVEPDTAVVTVGLQLYNTSSRAAANELRETMGNIVDALTAMGIPGDLIQTAQYSIYFERDYESPLSSLPAGGSPPGIYRVDNTIRITVTDITMAAAVTEAAIDAGANQINGIEFLLADPESVEREARTLAVRNARDRAELLAAEAGYKLGDLIEISEVHGGQTFSPSRGFALEARSMGVVQPGSMPHVVNVQVTYSFE